MVITRGVDAFLVTRYIVFGLFTICNAITCSVAVWNHSFVLYTQPAQVDIYLIFLGAFSLLSIFTLIFVELLCVNALTTRVWFECTWVTIFWLMELAGGAALIAVGSDIACSGEGVLCASQRVLLAFTWMCSVMLLVYLLTLVFLATTYYVKDSRIWVANVRTLRAAPIGQVPPNTPQSPLTTRFRKRPDKFNPHPTRPQPVHTFSRPAGLSSKYKIEPFPPVFAAPEQMEVRPPLDLPEAIPLPPTTIISSFSNPIPKKDRNVRSLSLGQPDLPPELVTSIEYRDSGRPSRSGPVPGHSTSLPTPSPLGDWPRQDVMQLPVKSKRKPPPPSAFEFPRQQLVTAAPTDRTSILAETLTLPRPRRPSGPRQRIPSGESGHRPPPLELYGIRV